MRATPTLRILPTAHIEETRRLAGTEAYVWAFKQRAQVHHCIGYGTFQVELDRVSRLRKRYAREVRAITLLPVVLVSSASVASLLKPPQLVLLAVMDETADRALT